MLALKFKYTSLYMVFILAKTFLVSLSTELSLMSNDVVLPAAVGKIFTGVFLAMTLGPLSATL